MLKFWGFFRPAQRTKRHQGRAKPGIEYVGVTRQGTGIASSQCLYFRIGFGPRYENLPSIAIPRWNLMAPPQLARNTPILNVL